MKKYPTILYYHLVLCSYALGQWEATLLNFELQFDKLLVALADVECTFVKTALWEKSGQGGWITTEGYNYVMNEPSTQLWMLLLEFLLHLARQKSSVLLNLLLDTSFQQQRQICKPCQVDSLEPLELRTAVKLAQLGVLVFSHGGRWFSSTFLAVTLSVKCVVWLQQRINFIAFLEMNNRLYTYSRNFGRFILLRLFSQPESLLPGLYIATLLEKVFKEPLSLVSAQRLLFLTYGSILIRFFWGSKGLYQKLSQTKFECGQQMNIDCVRCPFSCWINLDAAGCSGEQRQRQPNWVCYYGAARRTSCS
jgi:hypothetical protein